VISPANSLAETEEGMKRVDTKSRQISRMAFILDVDTACEPSLPGLLLFIDHQSVCTCLMDWWIHGVRRTKPNEVGR
jgi:hypothetical protein